MRTLNWLSRAIFILLLVPALALAQVTANVAAGYPLNFSMFYFTPLRCPGFPAYEPNFFICS
jgi:hypothetical protein